MFLGNIEPKKKNLSSRWKNLKKKVSGSSSNTGKIKKTFDIDLLNSDSFQR